MSDIFKKEYFEKHITTIVPIINVDLIVKDEDDNILLSWRKDELFCGWHIPGRIVRFQDSLQKTCEDCARIELFNFINTFKFLEFFETIQDRETRGHFITFVYECFLPNHKARNLYDTQYKNGGLGWFRICPDDLIEEQEIYRKYFKEEIHE